MLTRWCSGPIRRQIRSTIMQSSSRNYFKLLYPHSITAPNKITAINGIVKIVICTPAFCVSSQSIIAPVVSIFFSCTQQLILLIYLGVIQLMYIWDPILCLLVKRKKISRDWLPGEWLKTLRLTWIATMISPRGPLISLISAESYRLT